MRTLLLSAVLLASPALVHANDMRVSSYEMSESGGVVLLESDTPIGEPWLKVEAKQIRIWFPEVKYVARFEHARDAQEPLRSLELRPGAQDTAVLRIELAPGQRLSREDVEITRQGLTAKVHVRLPSNSPVPVPVPVPVPAAQPTAAKQLYPQPQAAPQQQPQPAATTTQPAAATTQPAAPSAVQNLRDAAAASDAQRGLNFASGSNGGLTGLAVISALLLAAYAGIRTFGKKRATRDPDIQVLSARRLGHRSELLLVRALGSDHLLMTSAGRVERVASAPSPTDPAASTLDLPLQLPAAAPQGDTAESQAEGLGIITKLSSRSRLRKLLDAVDQEPAEAEQPVAPAPRNSGRPSFGPELLSAIHHHKLNAIASLPSLAQSANKQSDAVAGIARLRAGGRGSN